jgi:hypothetical protein
MRAFPGDSGDGGEEVNVAWLGDFIASSDDSSVKETSLYK